MINRYIVDVLLSRIKEKHNLIQALVGPRQVGKTTAVKAALRENCIYETADYPTPLPFTVIQEWWEKALSHPSKTLAIDEVHKIPGWSEVIKKLWDTTPKKIKLVITGSSALLIEKGLKETLAGRFELIKVEHWNYAEAKKSFNFSINQFIEFGCYPGSVPFLNNKERWGIYIRDSIVESVLGRDLLQLHPIEQPSLLRQIFGVAISLPSQIISLQKIQGQLQHKGSVPTIQTYLKLLSDAFLISSVEKYSPSMFKTKKSSPKLLVHDNGLLRSFERPIHLTLSPERKGYYFENLIGARFLEAGWDLFYWKDRKFEVDFIVIGPENQKWAIEVKTSKTSLEELKGLFEFCKLYPEFEPCLISLINQKLPSIKTLDVGTILSLNKKYS